MFSRAISPEDPAQSLPNLDSVQMPLGGLGCHFLNSQGFLHPFPLLCLPNSPPAFTHSSLVFFYLDKQMVQVQISAPWGCQGRGNKPKVFGFEVQYSKSSFLFFHLPPSPTPIPPPPFFFPIQRRELRHALLSVPCVTNFFTRGRGITFHLIVLLPLSAPQLQKLLMAKLLPSPCHSAPPPPPEHQDLPYQLSVLP